MEVEGGNTSANDAVARKISIQSRRAKGCPSSFCYFNSFSGFSGNNHVFYQFTQQNLPACKPVLTPSWIVTTFLLMGVIFIPIGLVTLRTSHSVIEIVERYDTECIPEKFRGNKVPKHMKAPIYIYYQLDNYYQNHRRYVKSRNDQQLLHGLKSNDTSSCQPEDSSNGLPSVPCGLIAWSLFNDTFKFIRESSELVVNRKNIAWKSDRNHKFGKQVYPFNFQNGTFIGGGSLDPSVPLSDQEDLIVWMRTAALPSFRKMYGRIEEDLDADDVIAVHLMNNYNTYSFGGKKKLVLSTSSWLGGKNDFLGVAYVFVGSSSIIISLVFMLLHVKNPR
ncbi:putative ALA-interacting subunit 2 [Citrus sinensis]|uniref:ALA-interacting subunit 2 n=1 Tax=Citrus sinensis TaxID=2711 RepID=A0ACB8NFG8_CITSI|nr:putative ALA-interacting subunit 2 [Citrus sinensis]